METVIFLSEFSEKFQSDIKAVKKARDKLSKYVDGYHYIPCKIYQKAPEYHSAVTRLAENILWAIDNNYKSNIKYKNPVQYLSMLFKSSRTPVAHTHTIKMIIEVNDMLSIVDDKMISMAKKNMERCGDTVSLDNTAQAIRVNVEDELLAYANKSFSQYIADLKNDTSLDDNTVQYILDMLDDTERIMKNLATNVMQNVKLRNCRTSKLPALSQLASLWELSFNNDGKAPDEIFGDSWRIASEIYTGIRLTTDVSILLAEKLGCASFHNIDEYQKQLIFKIDHEYAMYVQHFDRNSKSAEWGPIQDKYKIIYLILKTTPPWNKVEQYETLLSTTNLLIRLYDKINATPDGWKNIGQIIAAYPESSIGTDSEDTKTL